MAPLNLSCDSFIKAKSDERFQICLCMSLVCDRGRQGKLLTVLPESDLLHGSLDEDVD